MNRQFAPIVSLAIILAFSMNNLMHAQYQLGDGQALDRNLRQGDSGRNQGRIQNTYGNYGNAIITGNVGGLGGFRGDAGYTSPNRFRGSLGSDDIFDFQRQSYLPTYNGQRVGPTNPPPGLRSWSPQANAYAQSSTASHMTVYRESTATSAGDIAGPNYAQQRFSATRNAGGFLPSPTRFNPSEQVMSIQTDQQGRMLQISTSPLMGLKIRPINPGQSMFQLPEKQFDPTATNPNKTDEQPKRDDLKNTNLNIWDTRFITSPPNLGEAIANQMQTQEDNRLRDPRDKTTKPLDQTIFNKADIANYKTGDDIYLDMLKKIDTYTKPANPLNTPDKPNFNDKPKIDRPNIPTKSSKTTRPVLPVYRGKTLEPLPNPTDDQNEQNQPDEKNSAEFETLIDKLNYDFPALKTYATKVDNPFNRSIRNAEQSMAKKKYFAADRAFDTAMIIKPGHPLALAGKINAQIGAGLFRSAGSNLYTLYNKHPELISTNYTQPILPTEKRLTSVTEQINKTIKEGSKQPQLAVVLAYIGYQQNNLKQTKEALDLLEKWNPNDKLLPLIKRLWLDK